MERYELAAPELPASPEELRRRAQSATGNAAQIAIIEIFGGIDKYAEAQALVGSNTALMSEILQLAAHKDNWRDAVRLPFDGTPEQVTQLVVAADLYGQAVHEGLDPAATELFAAERGYINADETPASLAVGLTLGLYRRFWDAEAVLSEVGSGFDASPGPSN